MRGHLRIHGVNQAHVHSHLKTNRPRLVVLWNGCGRSPPCAWVSDATQTGMIIQPTVARCSAVASGLVGALLSRPAPGEIAHDSEQF